jgi:insulysin
MLLAQWPFHCLIKINMTNNTSLKVLFLFLLFHAVALTLPASLSDLPEVHPLDESASRTLVLENGLEVILVSDPSVNISSAAMAIETGSLQDPKEVQGLAHFLEHMLFLGTEKYPDEGEYSEYLAQNGGYSNAYTAGDHTNYHFEVYPSAFVGALDRFSQFFIAPLFSPDFAEREVSAVDSEFEKNLESDVWRTYRLFAMHALEEHPANSFNIGNKETLANAKREQLLDFFDRFYSANRMALSLVSTHSLDQMEDWVHTYFSPIRNTGRAPLDYPTRYIENKPAVRFINMEAIEDRRRLNLYFNTPGIRDDWDAKSAALVSALLGYEGRGSLLSVLKARNLATGLGSGSWDQTKDYNSLAVTIELTPNGQENAEVVLELLMGYVELLRSSPYPDRFYDEQATMARLKDVYSDKGEGSRRSVDLANNALMFPLEAAEKIDTAFIRKDPDFYYTLLDHLRPENLLVILSAKGLETDRVEEIFGIEYGYMEIEGELYNKLANPEIPEALTLPQPNPFVPQQVNLLAEQPIQLIDEPGLSLYYAQDLQFLRPKVAMRFKVRLPHAAYSAADMALLDLYEATVREYVNEIAYDALMADLGYSVTAGMEGINVSLFGYNESAKRLLPVLLAALTEAKISPERFEAIRERLTRIWRNQKFGNAYGYVRYLTNKASYADYFLPDELAEAADKLTLDDVEALMASLFREGRIEALVYGNMDAAEAINAARSVQSGLNLKAPGTPVYETQLVSWAPGENETFKAMLPTNNSVFRKDYTLGAATPRNRVAAAVIHNLLQAPYYSELRTRQQLGYVVWSFTFDREDEVKLGYLIQSGDYDPVELLERSDAYVAQLPELLKNFSAEEFAKAKDAVRSELKKEDKTIAEKAARFFDLAYEHGANWSRQEAALDALETLQQEDIVEIFEQTFTPQNQRYQLVMLFARQEAERYAETSGVEDINTWKTSRQFRIPEQI